MTAAGNLTTAEALEYTGMSRATFYRHARAIRIKRVPRGRARWPRAELDRMLKTKELR